MAMPRKSNAEHALHGRLDKIHDRASDVSSVPAGRPKIPQDITALGLRREFKAMCRLLADRRVSTKGDVELVRLFCVVKDRHIRNAALLAEEGELCTYTRLDSNGQPHEQVKTNLRLKICVEAERQMAAILNQLGLTPVSKDRAKPTRDSEEKKLDPMEVFLSRKNVVRLPAPTNKPV